MFDLHKVYPVILHLKSLSYILDNKGSHTQILCPLCDDATRRAGRLPHGHCYINNSSPVYYCHKCSSAGTLVKLLIATGFEDEDTLKYIASFIYHTFSKDYYDFNKKKIDYTSHDINKIVRERIKKFKNKNIQEYDQFKHYLFTRLGEIDFTHFLIYPEFTKFKDWTNLSCNFLNYDGELVTSRMIDAKGMRYNDTPDAIYYFQRKNFERYTCIILCEGPFDAISLYAFNNIFNHKNTLFISVCGKKYLSAIERLIYEDLLLATFEISLIFDNDVYNYKSYLYRARLLTKQFNSDIIIRGFKPAIDIASGVNDVDDYPSLQEL